MPSPEEIEHFEKIKDSLEDACRKSGTPFARAPRPSSRVSKFTVARLFNTGNYEHMRVELEITVPDGASAAEAFIGAERVLVALRPKCPVDVSQIHDLKRQLGWTEAEWSKTWHCDEKTPFASWREQTARELAEIEGKYNEWKAYQEKTRKLLDDLGAASNYKDAKLDWEQDDEL